MWCLPAARAAPLAAAALMAAETAPSVPVPISSALLIIGSPLQGSSTAECVQEGAFVQFPEKQGAVQEGRTRCCCCSSRCSSGSTGVGSA